MRKSIYGLFAMTGAIISLLGGGNASATVTPVDNDNFTHMNKSSNTPLVFSDVINQNSETIMAYHYSHRSHSSHSSHSSHYPSRF